MQVWVQKWEESERGWGTRPDGYTIHQEREHIASFLKEMRDRERAKNPSGGVPDEYSRPAGKPYLAEVTDPEVLGRLAFCKYGVWGVGDDPPPVTPGADRTGWVTTKNA